MTLEVAEPRFWNREQRPKADSETSPGATRDSWNVRDPEQDAS